MRRFLLMVVPTLCTPFLNAASYGFSDYYFADPYRHWHIESAYRWIGEAKFEKHRFHKLNYADADAGLYYTQAIDDENTLTYGVGYDYLKLGWKSNPLFSETNFHYFVGSIGYVSTTLERWRWIVNAGFSVDAREFDFGPSGVYHAMLWGRYHFSNCCGVHIGVLGWYGVKNGRGFPVFGFDWKFNDQWSANAIFPVDYSLTYTFDENWSIEAAYASFGGPYKYPRRAHEGINSFSRDPIFMVYSNGVDLTLKYKFEHLVRASLGIGWNFGGWILIKNHKNHHGKYFHFNSALYAQGSLAFTF